MTSARQFVDAVLWKGSGKIDDLLTSPNFFVNARLAKLYPDAVVAQPPADDNTFVPATWPASEGRSGLLTQPSYLWAQSDPAINSIVKRGKEIHDDVLCQDPIGSPIDLGQSGLGERPVCKSADGTQTLSTCDSEVLQADARAFRPAVPGLPPADGPLRAGASELRPHRQLSDAGRGRPADRPGRHVLCGRAAGHGRRASTRRPISGPGFAVGATDADGRACVRVGRRRDRCLRRMRRPAAAGDRHRTGDLRRTTRASCGPIRAANDGTIKSLFINLLSPDFMRARAGGPK